MRDVAAAHALLGNVEEAMAWLTRAREVGWANVAGLAADPAFDVIRSDPGNAARLDGFRIETPLPDQLHARIARVARTRWTHEA